MVGGGRQDEEEMRWIMVVSNCGRVVVGGAKREASEVRAGAVVCGCSMGSAGSASIYSPRPE